MISITNLNENILLALGETFVVDFSATWCGPCRAVKPIFEQLATEFPKQKFVTVDVDENRDLAALHGVRGVPTFAIMKDGEVVATRVGAASKDQLKQWLEKALV